MEQKDKSKIIEKPEMPIGILKGQEIDDLLNKSIFYYKETFKQIISNHESYNLFHGWRNFIRCIDEFINIPFEISDEDARKYLSVKFIDLVNNDFSYFGYIISLLERKYDKDVSERFLKIFKMGSAIHLAYKTKNNHNLYGGGLSLDSVKNMIDFFQSRRLYYTTILSLIPQVAKGSKKIDEMDLLNDFQPYIDICLVNITTAYFKLLVNSCISDFEIISDGNTTTDNFNFSHLEFFFLEPQRLSLLDQLELRPDIVLQKQMLPKNNNKIFSFSEVANTMSLFEGAFQKYKIGKVPVFKELNLFLCDIGIFIQEDFNIIIEEKDFEAISEKYKLLKLSNSTPDYFVTLNSKAPFQKSNNHYYSTVVLLTRFIVNTLSASLMKNRTFQIHSGFVFEDKVANTLREYGFNVTDIKRINRKEFDLITIKNREIYNFQCKNNYYDISTVNLDYKKIARLNNKLCNYYEKALIKEIHRENLIIDKLGINDIHHFVVSRYPVITRNKKIINFNQLEKWLIESF